MTRFLVRAVSASAFAATATVLSFAPAALSAQSGLGVGGSVTPYVGYLVTGNWYDGPVGTSVSAANTPLIGAQLAIPLTAGLSLTGNVGYASGDALPI